MKTYTTQQAVAIVLKELEQNSYITRCFKDPVFKIVYSNVKKRFSDFYRIRVDEKNRVCPGYGMKQPAWRVVVSWIPDQCGNQLPFILVPCQSDSLSFNMFEHGDSNTVALRYQEEDYMISFSDLHDIIVVCSYL